MAKSGAQLNPAGLLAFGSSPYPRLPVAFDSGSSGGLTDYSGASAADFHRFPFLRSLDERHRVELALLCDRWYQW